MKEIMKAVVLAQKEISNAELDATNPHFRSKYATLESYIEAIKGTLNKYDLAVMQSVTKIDGGLELITTLAHVSGETLETRIPLILAKNDMQGLGSAIKYARRYALAAFFNVGSEDKDDDANATTAQTTQAYKSSSQTVAVPIKSGNRFNELGNKCFTFGKHKDKLWKSMDPSELKKYADWMISDSQKNNKPASPLANEALEFVELGKQPADSVQSEIDDFLNAPMDNVPF